MSPLARQRAVLVGLIPARGGSKRLPRKNLALVSGVSLLELAVRTAIESGVLDRVVVSSDDEEILRVAQDSGADALVRPSELASDTAPMDGVLVHALGALASSGQPLRDDGALCLLQPTSPLRTAEDVRAAAQLYRSTSCTGVISVTEEDRKPFKFVYGLPDGTLSGLASPRAPFTRGQDLPPLFRPNGAIYIWRAGDIARHQGCFVDGTLPYIMPTSRSLDIDDSADLADAANAIEESRNA